MGVYSHVEKLYIGTSGWVYKGWAGAFYPKGLKPADHFNYYATNFPTVEINATFYRLPSESMVRGWHSKAPDGFIFAVKGSRFITQMKKLNVDRKSIQKFFKRVDSLAEHMGPILWQLPPMLHKDTPRLRRFLELLPSEFRYAVEFRRPSWIEEEVFDLLREHDCAHVSVSSLRMPMDLTVTTDFVYIRFHGLEDGAAHNYTREELEPWAEHCRSALEHGKKVYAYFNNDWNCRAPENAKAMIEMTRHELISA